MPHGNDVQKFCNTEGIIAYEDQELFDNIRSIKNSLKL